LIILILFLDMGSLLNVSILIFGLSPILKTLMKTISTDTIYAMAVSCVTYSIYIFIADIFYLLFK